MLKILIVYLLYFVKDATVQGTCEAENQYPWSYHGSDNGPLHWGDLYPDCNGRYPSPIKINEVDVDNSRIQGLVFVGFDQPLTKAKVQNLGWTVMITPEDDVQRSIKWTDVVFKLESIQFHFGTESEPGAEHVLNGVRYPMEIYYYTTYNDGEILAILSTFMDVNSDDNSAFDPIVDIFSDIMYRNDSTEIQSNLNLSKLLPEISSDSNYFYLYEGSNSIPPCEPRSIRWILKDAGKIGRDQLDAFMSLYSVGESDASDECLMGQNNRPVQSRKHRLIVRGPQSDRKE